jgi:precorrin-2 dehydrogenase/sirohydrochlorin ferrochelatase
VPVAGPQYPVSLVLDGRPVLVVGGGRVAARKVEGLRACGADVHVLAPDVAPEIKAMDDVSWEERPYRSGDVIGYRLVFTAADESDVNRTVHDDAEAEGIWVNSADDPDNCTFTLPSVVRRGPITVAVSTGGTSPALAAWLRRKLEAEVGPEYEILLGLLAEGRAALQTEGRATEDADWQRALDSEILEMIRGGRVTEAREHLQSWL